MPRERCSLDREAIERELRRLFHLAADTPLPAPDLDDEELAEYVRKHASDPTPTEHATHERPALPHEYPTES